MAMIPWWIHYPNVNNEIINLDWIIQISNENTEKIENFIGVNTIKYADPILWDITSQYEANTIVVDPQTGDAYISTKAVPYGVALSNESYWTRIYNYASEIHTFREQIAADEQLSTTATAPRVVNDLVFLNGLLYRVTAPMIAGDSYVEGSNCVKTTINVELLRLHTSIGAESQSRVDADTALGQRIDDEIDARADADTALGQRIDDEIDARADADTALGQRIDDEIDARADADTALQSQIGTLSNLNTTDKSSVVAAINEIENQLGSADAINSNLRNKRILVVGDSISDEEHFPNCWVKFLREVDDVTVDALAINGAALAGTGGIAEAFINRTVESYDYIIFEAGVNDWGAQISLGNYSSNTIETFMGAINQVINKCKISYSNAKVFWITPLPTFFDESLISSRKVSLNMYRSAIYYLACYNKEYLIDGACGIPNYNDGLTLDHIHPNATGAVLLNELVKINLLIPSSAVGDVWDYYDFAATTAGLSGTIRVLTNCHGTILFRININVNTTPTPNTFIVLSNDSAWPEYLGSSIPYFPVIYQGQTKVENGALAWSTVGLQGSTPINEIGRFIGDLAIHSNLFSPPYLQN